MIIGKIWVGFISLNHIKIPFTCGTVGGGFAEWEVEYFLIKSEYLELNMINWLNDCT